MKIAVATENGTDISQHFGRAPLYVVLTAENGEVANKETREKAGHHTFARGPRQGTVPGERRGYNPGSPSKHAAMTQNIGDCQVVISGGMGWGAYESLKHRGVETIVTDVVDIEEAVNLYLQGKLPNLTERLH